MRKIAFWYLVVVLFSLWGYLTGRLGVFPARFIDPFFSSVRVALAANRDSGKTFLQRLTLHRQLIPRRFVTVGFQVDDPEFSDDGFLLLSRFSSTHRQAIVELIRLRDFSVLHTWVPPIRAIVTQTAADNLYNNVTGYRAQHPLLMLNGDIVFTSGEGALVRLSKSNEIVWLINRCFHHSIEADADGRFIVPCVAARQTADLGVSFRDDTYAVVSQDGHVVDERSVAKLLLDGGFRGLLLGVGQFIPDRIHLNDAQPINSDVGIARKGDIALSIRNLSTVLLYRPSTNEIVWLKTGPWLYQHDVNILPSGSFTVFGNDIIDYRGRNQRIDATSSMYVYEPDSGFVTKPLDRQLAAVGFYTDTEGRGKMLSCGDVVVEETDHHRILRVGPDGVRWQYVNVADMKTSGAVHWSRYLTVEEVGPLDWLPDG